MSRAIWAPLGPATTTSALSASTATLITHPAAGSALYVGQMPATVRLGTCSFADEGLLKGFELFRSAVSQPEEKRDQIAQEIWKLLVDQVWSIDQPAFAARLAALRNRIKSG